MLKKIIIWTVCIVFVLPIVGFIIIVITQATRANTIPGDRLGPTVQIPTSASSTSPVSTSSTTEANQFLERITARAFHYGDDTLPSGFLVPTVSSIPSGFVATQRIYRPNAYILKFEPSSGAELPRLEFMGSQKGTKPAQDATTAYSNALEQATREGEQKVMDFTYLDSPGMILTSTTFNIKSNHLIWNDNGYQVSITVTGFPDDAMMPANLVDLLKTMVRN